MARSRRWRSVLEPSEPTIVARHMIEAINYLMRVATGANLPRLATRLGRVRGELLLIEATGEDAPVEENPASETDATAGPPRR